MAFDTDGPISPSQVDSLLINACCCSRTTLSSVKFSSPGGSGGCDVSLPTIPGGILNLNAPCERKHTLVDPAQAKDLG